MPRKASGENSGSGINITMKDIAEAAGVTKATVSMVLSKDRRISEATRLRVMEVVRRLGYVPNEAARKLALGKSGSIAFVAVRFASPEIASVLDGIEQQAYGRARYLRAIQPYSTFNQVAAREEILREILFGRKAEAVILFSVTPSQEIIEEYRRRGVPLVLIECEAPGTHSVRVNNMSGAYRATEYLIKSGRKKIVFVGGKGSGKAGEEENSFEVERFKGYRAALKDHGILFDESRVSRLRAPSADEGALAFEALQRRKAKFDAILCAAGDSTALGIMEAARFYKVNIPKSLALLGYDDLPFSALLDPALSSVHVEFKELGSMAFDIAVEAIEGRVKAERKIVIDPELVIRESA